MKKKVLKTKLTLRKQQIANLNEIKGGYMEKEPPTKGAMCYTNVLHPHC